MFSRAVEKFISRGLLRNGLGSRRAVVASKSYFSTQNLADNERDIIIKSQYPPLKYPDWTIDQYVWNDISHWTNKTALVITNFECESFQKLTILFYFRTG